MLLMRVWPGMVPAGVHVLIQLSAPLYATRREPASLMVASHGSTERRVVALSGEIPFMATA